MTRTVIFDFDGTLTLGSGPIDAYVREIALATDDPGVAKAVRELIVAFESGDPRFIDAYDVVRHVAVARRIDAATLQHAYRRSREALASEAAPIEAPAGITEFLTRIGEHADIVLATNAPDTRVPEALRALGVESHFATRHTSVGKPQGLTDIVSDALQRGPVVSIGDIYVNDLAPAAALGASTALIGPTWLAFRDQVTMSAPTLPELYHPIEMWAGVTTPAPPVPPGTGPTHERHH